MVFHCRRGKSIREISDPTYFGREINAFFLLPIFCIWRERRSSGKIQMIDASRVTVWTVPICTVRRGSEREKQKTKRERKRNKEGEKKAEEIAKRWYWSKHVQFYTCKSIICFLLTMTQTLSANLISSGGCVDRYSNGDSSLRGFKPWSLVTSSTRVARWCNIQRITRRGAFGANCAINRRKNRENRGSRCGGRLDIRGAPLRRGTRWRVPG